MYISIMLKQLLLGEFVKFEFPWSCNKQCRTFMNTLKRMSTECKQGDFNLLNYSMTIVVNCWLAVDFCIIVVHGVHVSYR